MSADTWCWSCFHPIDRSITPQCPICGWNICPACGACSRPDEGCLAAYELVCSADREVSPMTFYREEWAELPAYERPRRNTEAFNIWISSVVENEKEKQRQIVAEENKAAREKRELEAKLAKEKEDNFLKAVSQHAVLAHSKLGKGRLKKTYLKGNIRYFEAEFSGREVRFVFPDAFDNGFVHFE